MGPMLAPWTLPSGMLNINLGTLTELCHFVKWQSVFKMTPECPINLRSVSRYVIIVGTVSVYVLVQYCVVKSVNIVSYKVSSIYVWTCTPKVTKIWEIWWDISRQKVYNGFHFSRNVYWHITTLEFPRYLIFSYSIDVNLTLYHQIQIHVFDH